MLETYFGSPKMVAHLRAGPSGPYMDGFAGSLECSGYEPSVAVRYLRAAAHIGHFTLEQGGTLANVDLLAFSGHLRTCRCPRLKGGRRNHHTVLRRQALSRIPCDDRRQPMLQRIRDAEC